VSGSNGKTAPAVIAPTVLPWTIRKIHKPIGASEGHFSLGGIKKA
jgi:hypothetical protein